MEMETSAVVDQAQNKILCSDTDASACQTVVSAKLDPFVTQGKKTHYKGHSFLSLLADYLCKNFDLPL